MPFLILDDYYIISIGEINKYFDGVVETQFRELKAAINEMQDKKQKNPPIKMIKL